MILIAGTVDVDPERREAALEAGKPHVAGTRAQKGCVAYVWSADPMIDGRIVVYEHWETEEDLALHLAGEHYLNMRNTIAGFGLTAADVSKFRVDLREPVYDSTGTPRADFLTG
ncbi:MAG: putative quinol monooxygenase [Myxococcota bacterium]|jgi:quinol monooxygenase YgiN|nr:putative quinol monooxygenase [Myxococcota bacterium]